MNSLVQGAKEHGVLKADFMNEQNIVIFTLGSLFMLGLVADITGRFTFLPRVTILLLCGVLVGPHILDLLPRVFIDNWFVVITDIALGMIGFLLGQKITINKFKKAGKAVIGTSLFKVAGAFIAVFAVLALVGMQPAAALILAAIASPSAPAAVYDVINELKVKNDFSENVLEIVAIDDLWGLIIFTVCISFVGIIGTNSQWMQHLMDGFIELFGSVGLGLVFGIVIAWVTGRIRPGEPTQAEALGAVFLTVSLAKYFDFSPLLASMVLGATVANFALHHHRPFEAIEGFEWPFLIIFFLLAGASLHLDALLSVGIAGAGYIAARFVGIFFGARLGAKAMDQDSFVQNRLGMTLFPQAGVAVGMALMAAQQYPQYRDLILPIIIGSTVVFELIGPVFTRKAIKDSENFYNKGE